MKAKLYKLKNKLSHLLGFHKNRTKISNGDIVDLVQATVEDSYTHIHGVNKPIPDVWLNGDTVVIGSESVPIVDIIAKRNDAKGFVKLIKNVINQPQKQEITNV